MDIEELAETIKKKDQLLAGKDKMILSLILQLNRAYSHFNSDQFYQSSDDPRRQLLSDDKDNYDDSAAVSHTSPSLVFDESIFSNSPEPKHDSCMLCLFPMRDSLHGSQPPKTYSLECGHSFHLLCLYETVQRRECRKVCGECWIDITETDQEHIMRKGKVEKRKIFQESKDLASKISKYSN